MGHWNNTTLTLLYWAWEKREEYLICEEWHKWKPETATIVTQMAPRGAKRLWHFPPFLLALIAASLLDPGEYRLLFGSSPLQFTLIYPCKSTDMIKKYSNININNLHIYFTNISSQCLPFLLKDPCIHNYVYNWKIKNLWLSRLYLHHPFII